MNTYAYVRVLNDLHLQGPLKGHKFTHAENEVQADDGDDDDYDDDDDADDDENDNHAADDDGDDADDDDDDDDAKAHPSHSGLHACMNFASRALHQIVCNRSSQLLLIMKSTSTCLKKKMAGVSPCTQGSKKLTRLLWFTLSVGLH